MGRDDGLPIIGSLDRVRHDKIMENYLAALESMIGLHQIHIRDASSKMAVEWKAAESRPDKGANGVYLELLSCQIATHAVGISTITGQLALMAAMGLENIPEPPEIGSTQEMMH